MNRLSNQVLNEINKIISSIETLLERLGDDSSDESIEASLLCASKALCNQLYMACELDVENNIISFGDSTKNIKYTVKQMITIWKLSVSRREHGQLDNEFWMIYEFFKYVNRDHILSYVIDTFNSYDDDYKRLFLTLTSRYTFLKGKIDAEENDYSLIEIYVDMMKSKIEDFKWLYERLADHRSKRILLRIVRFWFEFDLNDLSDLHENIFGDYFDTDIFSCGDEDVYVDCGAYVGDSILGYINTFGGHYKRIIGYEIDPDTIKEMKQNLEGYDKICFRQKGVSDYNGLMYIDEDSGGAGTRLAESGSKTVKVVTLDLDVKETISVIKMDIEGAEQQALRGAKKHIENEKPKLLICTYHKPEDLFEIPRLIDDTRADYNFYLRFNGRGIWPCDHVIMAV